ncbi:MAG TPA: NAD(P)H-hydrate epimerase [Bacteroidetes bacterium]|nr:NAD(P)H-hydrate epimerase [Bacteroidota bacterium]
MAYFPKAPPGIPAINKSQMVEVDRLMVDDYGISLIQMMENAGRSLAVVAREAFFRGNIRNKGVVVLAGTGGNGGGALACARRLHIWGARVRVTLSKPLAAYRGVPARQLQSLQKMGVVLLDEPVKGADLLVDGLVGYSLQGDPHGRVAELIEWANRQITPMLALDVPSGLDSNTGKVHSPCIRASATMTLALPKTGLLTASARPQVGELYLADISVPQALYAAPALKLSPGAIFANGDILKL